MKLLRKGVAHIGVGTPGRISALIEKGMSVSDPFPVWLLLFCSLLSVTSLHRGPQPAGFEVRRSGLELEGPEAQEDGGHSRGELLPSSGSNDYKFQFMLSGLKHRQDMRTGLSECD